MNDDTRRPAAVARATRRGLLASGGALALGSLAGCLGSGDAAATPTPVALDGEKQDDEGGMVIGLHGGPNGQLFYPEPVTDHGNPAWFHTLTFGLFPFYFRELAAGNEPTAVYATDYSTVEYEVAERDGRPVVPAPTGAETFGNARELTYVHGSEVRGGMGPALVPFSEDADADAFVSRFGSERIAFDDIDEGFLARYGQRR